MFGYLNNNLSVKTTFKCKSYKFRLKLKGFNGGGLNPKQFYTHDQSKHFNLSRKLSYCFVFN